MVPFFFPLVVTLTLSLMCLPALMVAGDTSFAVIFDFTESPSGTTVVNARALGGC
jgi:hypothetical protein